MPNEARCVICHRAQRVVDGRFVAHSSGSRECSGSGASVVATDPTEILAGLSSEQRAAVWRLRSGPKFLGPTAVPRLTAAALRRRGLIEDYAGSMVRLTELGGAVAEVYGERVRVLLADATTPEM